MLSSKIKEACLLYCWKEEHKEHEYNEFQIVQQMTVTFDCSLYMGFFISIGAALYENYTVGILREKN